MIQLLPQLANDASEAEASQFIVSDDWMAQEKADGIRIMLVRQQDQPILCLNKQGVTTTLPKGTVLPQLPPSSVLDSEFISATRRFTALDCLKWSGESWQTQGALARYRGMAALDLGPRVDLIPCGITLEEKARLIKRLREEQAEGIILKRCAALWTPGRPPVGGDCRRVKWRKRCEVVLYRRHASDTKRSFEMFLYDGPTAVHVGSVSAHTFYDQLTPEASAVAEVEYLYATRDRRLFQPTVIRWRGDKTKGECVLSQLIIGKKFLTQKGVA